VATHVKGLRSPLHSYRIGLPSCQTFVSVSGTLGRISLIMLQHSLFVDLRARRSWLVGILTIRVSSSEVRTADYNHPSNFGFPPSTYLR